MKSLKNEYWWMSIIAEWNVEVNKRGKKSFKIKKIASKQVVWLHCPLMCSDTFIRHFICHFNLNYDKTPGKYCTSTNNGKTHFFPPNDWRLFYWRLRNIETTLPKWTPIKIKKRVFHSIKFSLCTVKNRNVWHANNRYVMLATHTHCTICYLWRGFQWVEKHLYGIKTHFRLTKIALFLCIW